MMTTSVRVLSDGIIKFDGGTMFGQVPKVAWEAKVPTDRRNRVTLGLNSLLIQVGGRTVLVDAGVGSKELDNEKDTYGLVPSRLMKGLRSLGLTPKDIDAVILTHLHFDHSGGCTRLDRVGDLVPAFPKAKYYVQRVCWQDACSPNERCRQIHRDEDFRPIEERGQLELLDGDADIFPGLSVRVTDGHARGHQVVLLNHGGERIAFLGDLVPTPYHLDLAAISAYDQYPEETLEMKRDFLSQASKAGWLLVFSHGHNLKAGYLERRNGDTFLRPVEL
jgi:glyoxylase-like metal-dependent hydrolase (beta-lactamase superfamily II)